MNALRILEREGFFDAESADLLRSPDLSWVEYIFLGKKTNYHANDTKYIVDAILRYLAKCILNKCDVCSQKDKINIIEWGLHNKKKHCTMTRGFCKFHFIFHLGSA